MSGISIAAYKTNHQKRIRGRKNLGLIAEIVQKLCDSGTVPVGAVIETTKVVDVIKANGCEHLWDRDKARQDEVGLSRSVGDLLGGHGLGLRKHGRTGKYVMPHVMPKVNGDDVIAEPTYKTVVQVRQ